MRVLIAAADRDLLACYEKILSAEFGDAVTAFTGTQALEIVADGAADAVVVDSEIPLADHSLIVKAAAEKGIPSVVLACGPAAPDDAEPSARLLYPFAPDRLISVLKETKKTKGSTVVESE